MRKNILSIISILCCVLGSSLTSMGAGFQSLGYQAISMGGAGVAYTNGSYAAYYNPALLANNKYAVEINLSPGVGFREHNLADHIDALAEIGVQDTIDELSDFNFTDIQASNSGDTITATTGVSSSLQRDLQTIQKELDGMSSGNGLELIPSVSLGVQVKNFGFGVYGLADTAASAVIDSDRLGYIVPVEANNTTYYVQYDPAGNSFTLRDRAYYEANSLDYAIETGTTTVKVIGVTYLEIPMAYGYQFDTDFGKLSAGASFKIMSGKTYKVDKPIDSESGDLADDLDDYEKDSTTFGVDLGLLYNPPIVEDLSVGLVIKNINTPKFDLIDGSTLDFDPQARLGVAYSAILDRLTLALDMDLTSNDSLIPGYEEQYIGGGADFHPFSWFSIRLGMMKNIKESDEGNILTAGLGLGVKWFQFDIAGQYSTKDGSYDGNDYPRAGRIQVSLVSKWF
jgi:hypothetical protein